MKLEFEEKSGVTFIRDENSREIGVFLDYTVDGIHFAPPYRPSYSVTWSLDLLKLIVAEMERRQGKKEPEWRYFTDGFGYWRFHDGLGETRSGDDEWRSSVFTFEEIYQADGITEYFPDAP